MCGIVGIAGKLAEEKRLEKMLSVQHHRGPDFTGKCFPEKRVALGHNRLSIIDLSAEANQPMSDESGRYTIVFNGEIYNYLELREELKELYSFQTSSDTEVLLAAYTVWGSKMLEYLNGMFAFVIYDKKTKTLFGARDRFGVKPLYYAILGETLFFASEIGALKAGIPKRVPPNEKVWASYLVYGSYGEPSETFWEGIWQIPAGHCFSFSPNEGLKIRQWYDFVSCIGEVELNRSLEEVLSDYESLLMESVSLRFRADVEVGFNLSGGLDSSTLLATVNAAQTKRDKIKAYTFYTGDSRYDETPWVEQMVSQTKNPLEKVLLRPEDVPQLAKELHRIQEEPYGGIPTIAYAQLFKRARENGTLVLLDGQGMDEQWAGYDYYTVQHTHLVQGVKSSPVRPNVLNRDFASLARKLDYPTPFKNRVQNLQYRDLFYTKIPRALRFNDRNSMAFSVELREPFLDYRLVELAFAQPTEYKIRNRQKKWLLRQIATKYLGDSIALSPKRPLQTPQREWLGDELAPFVEEQIDKILFSDFRRWFDEKKLYREWKAYRGGERDNAFYIWQWVSVGLMVG